MIELQDHDALLIVDVQKDFLPGGALPVPEGDEVVPVLNRYIERFTRRGLPVFATRDWHPPNHCSFRDQGGPWPPHCVAGTKGAEFADGLRLPEDTVIVSKATGPEREAYSGFEGTDLAARLKDLGIRRLFVGGLATDYCVLNTVRDAIRHGFEVFLLTDAVRAVNVHPEDERKALEEMRRLGARFITLEALS
ncbi:nicotinamidase/pyrazinamidase [Methylomarinovum caldicuralii]|uniref:nicotinamidase n=1 Tax=Methylomarinovum caldicuralii TaxID=438856 RepID=A0AAU9C0M6_9GAMM|nr:nicotinamidase [Methylomarinovum caldicuralii]BCX82225.1 nicotinamidase/pyrazinamidase [Methylomarinovum caldicuralii]